MSKYKQEKKKIERQKSIEDIMFKNMEMIEKIEDTPPKISSWNNLNKLKMTIKTRKDRIYNPENIERTLCLIKDRID